MKSQTYCLHWHLLTPIVQGTLALHPGLGTAATQVSVPVVGAENFEDLKIFSRLRRLMTFL